MDQKKRLVVANWKMNPPSISEAKRLFLAVKKSVGGARNADVIICPPFVYLSELQSLYKGNRILLGAQDIFWEQKGSFTGEVSPAQLKSVGVRYVIVGHSERRSSGETNEIVNKKIRAALKEGLSVILCVGEQERDGQGEYLQFIRNELEIALGKIKLKDLTRIIIAYEPIWAIGKTGEDAITPEKLHEMTLFIRRVLIELYNKNAALDVLVLYGGSVERGNAEELLVHGKVQGFLVGHASLDAREFMSIVTTASKH